MNVKKNPFYYINTLIFMVFAIYSLLLCINVFDTENIDMNAGLCAVIVSMVLCLVMYLIYATRVRTMLAANPILKTSLEVISVLIFLTLSCVVRVYLMGEFELDITREGIVLLCMFMAYLTARMLNQYGFVTLMLLVPWPYLISTYHYDLQELIQFAAVIAGICVLSVILFAVRKKHGLRLAAMILFLTVVAAYFFYGMYQAGLTSVYVVDYKKYIEFFNKMFQFTQFERYYYIAAVMAAIIGGIRMLLGSGSGNTLILFIVNVLCLFTVIYDLGPMYLHFMYPLLAMAAAGSLGTRPAHEDEEVQLHDNLENVQVKYNKKDVVGLSYVDDSELDKMLEDIEKEHKYIPHKKLSEMSEDGDDDIPVELRMYDSAINVVDYEKENAVSNPEPVTSAVTSTPEPIAAAPSYEPVTPVVTSTPEPIAAAPSYEPVAPVMTSEPGPIAAAPSYEPVTPVMTSEPEPVAVTPSYEPVTPVMTSEPEPVTVTPSYEPVAPVMTSEPEPVAEAPSYEPAAPVTPVLQEPVMTTPAYETLEKNVEKTKQPEQPEQLSYEPEYHYEEKAPSYEPEYHYEEQTPSYEPEYSYEEKAPSYEPEYNYEEQTPSYEPEYVYEEEKTAAQQTAPEYFEKPTVTEEPVIPDTLVEEPVIPEPIYESVEKGLYEEKQPETVSTESEYHYEEQKPAYENYVQEEPQDLEPQLLIKNPVSFDNARDTETTEKTEDYEFIESKPMFETMASFFSNHLDIDNAPKFEMSQQDASSFDAYSAANEIYTPIDSMDELFTNADAGLDFEEVEPQQHETMTYSEDDELVEEPVINSAEPQPSAVMPENVELGVELEEEFGFGQTMSFTDFYDTETTTAFTGFEEIEEPEMTVSQTVAEFVEPEPVSQTPAIETPIMGEFTEPVTEAPIMEEVAAPVIEEVTNVPVIETPAAIEPEVLEFSVPEETVFVSENPVMEPVLIQLEEEHIEVVMPAAPAAAEVYVEPIEEKKVEEPVKQVNPFAKEDDFFDWSTYDGVVEEEPEPAAQEIPNEPAKPQAANDFEEFVWTDEMIKQFSGNTDVTAPQTQAVQEEDVPEVIEEIAATTVPESVFEPEMTVKVEEPSIQQVLVEKRVMQEVQVPIEMPVQEVSSPVPAAEEEPLQYQVYQSSGNIRFEEPEEPEEEAPQYQVYQSSGNFQFEEPEEPEEEAPQYQVYQSSGNFRLEEEEEEIVPTLVTYGGPQQNAEQVPAKTEEKPASGNKFAEFEFDLDLPDFEPINPTKR